MRNCNNLSPLHLAVVASLHFRIIRFPAKLQELQTARTAIIKNIKHE